MVIARINFIARVVLLGYPVYWALLELMFSFPRALQRFKDWAGLVIGGLLGLWLYEAFPREWIWVGTR
jgi:hypothetical protein